MRVLILQHSPASGPGRINQWLLERGMERISHIAAKAGMTSAPATQLWISNGWVSAASQIAAYIG